MKGNGVGWNIGTIDARKLDAVIKKPWVSDGSNFSDRIWSNKTSMVNALHDEITRSFILGGKPDDAIKNMEKYLQDSTTNAKRKAARLIQTEQAYFASEAQKDCFKDLDVEEFEFVASLDEHTCDICGQMDGQHLPMTDFKTGITAPPLHPFCRCTTVPFFNDEWADGERAARNADGQTYYVPADTTYSEWKKEHVEDATSMSDKEQYERYKSVLGDLAPKSLSEFITIKENDPNAWSSLKYQYRTVNRYSVDFGSVTRQQILQLDDVAFETKMHGFDVANIKEKTNSKDRKKIKSIPKNGNASAMEFDGKIYFSHSSVGDEHDLLRKAYVGDQ